MMNLRDIPSITTITEHPEVAQAAETVDRKYLIPIAQECQQRVREEVRAGHQIPHDRIFQDVVAELAILTGKSSNVTINGTGVIIHTNLGRAPVSAATSAAMAAAATNYLTLEVSPETGRRGGRGADIQSLMKALTGAERTLVVNNNAAAVTLTLAAMASGKEVVVSRGEAIEIGGGFRIPDVIRQSGARLVEVGTTNRTYISDFESALSEGTAAFLKVHHSNFQVIGFTAQPSISDIADAAHQHGVFAIEDVGSGCLIDITAYGLPDEQTLMASIAAGADVVTASGDKLLGGPQAGLILGAKAAVETIERHPLARAVRADKTVLAGIAATLRHYLAGEAELQVPVWWSISRSPEWLRQRAENWRRRIGDDRLSVSNTSAVVGGGSLPGRTLPSYGLHIGGSSVPVEQFAASLRTGSPALFPRVEGDAVIVDARTVLPDQDEAVVLAVRSILR